jgi:hypothetical protein
MSVIKMESIFNQGKDFKRVAQEVFGVRRFVTERGDAKKFLRKFNDITKLDLLRALG